MKFAFVHCWITPGGALNVLKDLINETKELNHGKVFTIFSDRKKLKTKYHTLAIITALPQWLNKLFLICSQKKIPFFSWLFDYRNLILFYPILMKILSKKIKKYKPDHIIISSFAVAKNITPLSGTKTTLYLHSPMQYIRTHYDEYAQKLTGIKGRIFKWIVPKLKKWDLKFTQFDNIYTNSRYTAQEAQKIYGMRNIKIKYPLITKKYFNSPIEKHPHPYYLYIGRLVSFVKEVDKIITLCNELKVPLIIMGSGPDEAYLKSIAGPTIIFIGWIKDENEKIKIIRQAKGLINLTKESYGIGTLEALLLGVPVFGYHQGATSELVDKDCGILVPNKEHKTLIKTFKIFMNTQRDRELIAKKTRKKWENNSK